MRVIERLWGAFGKKVSRDSLNLTYALENGRKNDRGMRDELEEGWDYEIPTMNLSDGEGYFEPYNMRQVNQYYAQEKARLEKNKKKLKVMDKLKADAAKQTFECIEDETIFLHAWIGKRVDEYKRKVPAEAATSDKHTDKDSTTA